MGHAITPQEELLDAMEASILPRTYEKAQVGKMIKEMQQDESNVIEEVIVAQHEDDRAIKGVKAGLASKEKRMMSAHDFHCMMGHLGVDPDCVICKEAKGTMRYIRRTDLAVSVRSVSKHLAVSGLRPGVQPIPPMIH